MPKAKILRRRLAFFLILGLMGLFLVLSSIANAYLYDYLQAKIRDFRFQDFRFTASNVEGGVFSGFIISAASLKSTQSETPLVKIDSIVLKLKARELVERKLDLEYLRLDQVFLDPVVLTLPIHTQTGTSGANLLQGFDLRHLYFTNLRLKDSQSFLSSLYPGVSILEEPAFHGKLSFIGGQLEAFASLSFSQKGGMSTSQPVAVNLNFDTIRQQGSLFWKIHDFSTGSWLGVENLEGEARISAEGKVDFSFKPQSSDYREVQIGNTKIWVKSEAQARLVSKKLNYRGMKFEDLSANTVFRHLDSWQITCHMNAFGGQIAARGDTKNAVFRLTNLELPLFLRHLNPDLAQDWSGHLDWEIFLENGIWSARPMKIFELGFRQEKLVISEIQVQGLNERMQSKEATLGLSCAEFRGFGLQIEDLAVSWKEDLLFLKGQLDHLSLKSVTRYLKASAPLEGEASGEFELLWPVQKSFDPAKIKMNLNLVGRNLKLDRLHFDGANLQYSMSEGSGQGKIDVRLAGKGGLLSADLIYKDQTLNAHTRVENLRPSALIEQSQIDGNLDGKIRMSFGSIWVMDVDLTSDSMIIKGSRYNDVSIRGMIQQGSLNLRIKDRDLNLVLRGTFTQLEQILNNLKLNFTLEENQISRALNLLNRPYLGSGSLIASGNYEKNHLHLDLERLNLLWQGQDLVLLDKTKLLLDPQGLYLGPARLGLRQKGKAREWFHLKIEPDKIRLETTDFPLSLVAPVLSLKPNQSLSGVLDLLLEIEGIKSKPQIQARFSIDQPSFTEKTQVTSVDLLSGSLSMDRKNLIVHGVDVIKSAAHLKLSGQMPSLIQTSLWPLQMNGDQPLQLALSLPKVKLPELQKIFPAGLVPVGGFLEVEMKIKGTINQPLPTGLARIVCPKLLVATGNTEIALENLDLSGQLTPKSFEIKALQGQFQDANFNLKGNIGLLAPHPFVLRGIGHKAGYVNDYLDLKDIQLTNVVVEGEGRTLMVEAGVQYDKGFVHYEKLTSFIKAKTPRLKIPGFETYELALKINGGKFSELKGDMLALEVNPEFTIRIRDYETILDGVVSVRKGKLSVARNRFTVDPSSYVRFTPLRPKVVVAGQKKKARPESLWESKNFQKSSMNEKLSLLWSDSQNTQKGNTSFETYLNLRAQTDAGKTRVNLNLVGPLESLNYTLSSDSGTYSGEELLRLLALSGAGRESQLTDPTRRTGINSSLQPDAVTDSREDQALLESQLSSALEDQLLGKKFGSVLSQVFNLDEVSLESNLLNKDAKGAGFNRVRMGTRIAPDLYLTHEQENMSDRTRNKTALELQINEKLDFTIQRDADVGRFDLGGSASKEEDFQFGFKRKMKF